MKRLAILTALLAAACSGNSGAPTAKPTTSPSLEPGPVAFLVFAHGASFGDKDFASAPDENLLSLGNNVCDGLRDGLTFAKVTQGLVESDAHPTVEESVTYARASVANLCPEETAG